LKPPKEFFILKGGPANIFDQLIKYFIFTFLKLFGIIFIRI